jgi:DNA-binding MarR family transcriptional regulator
MRSSSNRCCRARDALEADGLVRRQADPDDSRATRIFLTGAGRAAFETLWPQMAAAYAAMFRGVADDERRAFVATLQKIHRNIRRHDF